MPRRGKKVVLLGEASVGKTSIAKRFVQNDFKEHYESTIGAAYSRITYNNVQLDIWDTAGQERFLSLAPIYYRGANIIMLVFDLNNLDTLGRLDYYLEKIKTEVKDDYHCIIVGTKKDLIHNNVRLNKIKKVVMDRFEKYKSSIKNELIFKFVSSKTNENIDDLKDTISNFFIGYSPSLSSDESNEIVQLDGSYLNGWIPGCNC